MSKIEIKGSGKRLQDLPEIKPRKANFDIDYLILKLSGVNTDETGIYNDFAEMILCLANEINELKTKIKALENGKRGS